MALPLPQADAAGLMGYSSDPRSLYPLTRQLDRAYGVDSYLTSYGSDYPDYPDLLSNTGFGGGHIAGQEGLDLRRGLGGHSHFEAFQAPMSSGHQENLVGLISLSIILPSILQEYSLAGSRCLW